MNNQGITEDDFKKISLFEKAAFLQELRTIREKLKEGDWTMIKNLGNMLSKLYNQLIWAKPSASTSSRLM